MGKVIGIDLGTTNSVVAVMEGGEPVVIPNSEGGRTTPSVVAFTKDNERLVGQVARRQAITNPRNTVFSIKRFMGRKASEVTHEKKLVPYEVTADGQDRVQVNLPNAGKTFTPPEISAMILQKMKQTAEDYLGMHRDPGGGDGSRLFQRRPAAGHQGRRKDRRPGGAPDHQRAHRRFAGLRARTRRKTRRSPSSTWAEAPTTSPSWSSERASSR